MVEESAEVIVDSPKRDLNLPQSLSDLKDRLQRTDRESWIFNLFIALVITSFSIVQVQTVMASWGIYGFSFDDSWIHVQYARTIFEGRAWEYAWGIPSTGSSGPLWSIILSPIFFFGYGHDTVVTSVLVIASILYFVNVFLVGEIVKQNTGRWQYAVAGQVVFVLLPRNAGLMLSGMETPLGMLMILLALLLLPRKEWQYDLVLGVVAGLAYLCRPEFVLIAALCFPVRALGALKRDGLNKRRLLSLMMMFLLAALIVTPWILHCLNTTGLPMPDSYYSKLRWGVSDDGINLWNLFWFSVWLPSEPYLLLGFLGSAVILFKHRRPYDLILIASLFALYRLTMPGMSLLFAARYLVPLFDLLSIAFVCGTAIIVEKLLKLEGEIPKVTINERTAVAIIIVGVLFLPSIPSSIYHVDIHANQAKNIEEMQVTLALWIRENVPENATIATYDVGAIGFFANGVVLDIYGLVTPPILHNHTTAYEQAEYLREMNCTYIMFYVQWFYWIRYGITSLDGSITELYRVHLDDNVVCGTDDMAIFQIHWA